MAQDKGLSSEIRNIVSQAICDLRETMDQGEYGTASWIGYVALTAIEVLLEGAVDETDNQKNISYKK